MTSNEFRTRMRNHPLAPVSQRPATMVIPPSDLPDVETVPETSETVHDDSKTQGRRAAFIVPVVTDADAALSLDDLVALSKGGDEVPMPVARAMTAGERDAVLAGQSPSARMTKLERDTLTRLGWQEGEPVPPEFATELQKVFADYAAREQAKGMDISKIPMRNIEDLPSEEQAKLRESMRSMIDGMKAFSPTQPTAPSSHAHHAPPLSAYPESVRNALVNVDLSPIDAKPEFVKTPDKPDIPPPMPLPSFEKVPEPPIQLAAAPMICKTCGRDPKAEKKRLTCSHCGGDPLDDLEKIPIALEDKRAFLLSLGTRRPFEKEYRLFADTISVRFRALRSSEIEQLTIWSVRVAAKEFKETNPDIILTQEDLRDRAGYKELLGGVVLQTVLLQSRIEGSDLFWAARQEAAYPTMQDWEREYGIGNMDDLIEKFLEEVPSEPVLLALQYQLEQFNLLQARLGREAMNTQNFWKGT